MNERNDLSVTVDNDCTGLRLDQALPRLLPGYSRRLCKQLARQGLIRRDGRRLRPADRVSEGDCLQIQLPTGELEPTSDAPTLIHASDDLLYVAKPRGMHTSGRWPGQAKTLASWVAENYPECVKASPDPRECGAVHRLDRATSGLVTFARHRQAWLDARASFDSESVEKIYLATTQNTGKLAAGEQVEPQWTTPAEQQSFEAKVQQLRARWLERWPAWQGQHSPARSITAPLANSADQRRVKVHSNGRSARSTVTQIATFQGEQRTSYMLWLVQIHSGVRHQIRAHLAHIGNPILGDTLYAAADAETSETGASPTEPDQIALHAAHIAFPRPLGDPKGVSFDPLSSWLVPWLADEHSS